MSGYETPQDVNVNEHDARRPSQVYTGLTGYDARRPTQDPLYLQYALPGAADPQLQQSSTAYDPQTDHMDYGASPIYQPRATFEAAPSAYFDLDSRRTTKVSSYSPRRGNKGDLVYIYLDSSSNLLSATLMFAQCAVPAGLDRSEGRDKNLSYRYWVSATAPAFSETGSSHMRIPLSLQLQDQSTLKESLVYVGEWLYEDGKRLEHHSSPQEMSRKRKVADEPSDTPRSTKRETPFEQQTTQSPGYGSYPYPSASSAYPQSLDLSTMQRKYTPYGRSQLQQNLQPQSNTSQGLFDSDSTSQSLMKPPMGQGSSWNASHGAGFQSGRNPKPNMTPSFQVSSISFPRPVNPRLVRTSTLAPQPSPGTASVGSPSDRSFNPYTSYPNQALLELRGNLNAMQENWTPEERAVKRRIVRFWREQNWTTVNAYFKPVRADEQPLPHEMNERRISCIYWEERDEYYITSVDTISLLESLIDDLFGIDEKNRIRRNLEGCKPRTVHKGKADSESFYKLIMGFPNPKPRSIEKDVKVFEWPILEQALKKVISKYSGDTAFIASPRRRPLSSNFSGSQSEAGAGRYSALSSRSTSGSTASGQYAQSFKSSTLSPHSGPQALNSYKQALNSYAQASPSQQHSAPSLSHSYTVPTLGSQYMSNDSSNSPYAAQAPISDLSSAYTSPTIGRRRSSDQPIDEILASATHYSGRQRPSSSFASPYAPQSTSEATATLGLPGRASVDLSAYFNTDAVSSGSIGDAAQYGRYSGVKDEADMTQFKEE